MVEENWEITIVADDLAPLYHQVINNYDIYYTIYMYFKNIIQKYQIVLAYTKPICILLTFVWFMISLNRYVISLWKTVPKTHT